MGEAAIVLVSIAIMSAALWLCLTARTMYSWPTEEEEIIRLDVLTEDGVRLTFRCNKQDYWEVRTKLVKEFGGRNVKDV